MEMDRQRNDLLTRHLGGVSPQRNQEESEREVENLLRVDFVNYRQHLPTHVGFY
jgi:adenine-specific DNA methylase